MVKQILYFIFFISGCVVMAQTSDTIKVVPTQTTLASPSQPTITTTPTETAQPQQTATVVPTQTLQPVTITTQTLQPTMPNIKHRRKKNESFKKENEEIVALYKLPFDKKQEIVLQNKRYRIYNNYVNIGLGKCYNSGWQDLQQVTSFDYNFHLKRNRFQAGFMLVGPGFRNNNVVQLHAGMGYRIERCNYHWAVYGGLSYSQGYKLQNGTPTNNDTTYKYEFKAIGAYADLQFYYKLKFDYGLGASAFIDANSKQVLTGLKINIFLSGAYKGLKKINYAKEEEKEK